MSRQLPPGLMDKPNSHLLVMDRHNIAHKRVPDADAACGMLGREVTLGQAIVWGVGICDRALCYPPKGGRRSARNPS